MDVTVDLDEEVFLVLQRRAEKNGFDSTAEYCEAALGILASELEPEGEPDDDVEERLEDLGYLN